MVVLTAVFWRWLKIATFDEGFARRWAFPRRRSASAS
jgi:ABC-type Mn2+/Zn2+ transport system permease subunit